MVNEAGDNIIGTKKKKEAWKTYLEKLLHDLREEQDRTVKEGPETLFEEVRADISQMKPRKEAGPNRG